MNGEPSDAPRPTSNDHALTPNFALSRADDGRLELRFPDEPSAKPLRLDLTRHDTRSPAGRRTRQPLARAIGLHKKAAPGHALRVIDATAGFGKDAWLLAAMGCRVTAIERHPIVAALLEDAITHAARTDADTAARLQLIHGDAAAHLNGLADETSGESKTPDAIYIDPIFPTRRGSALQRRPMRLLRELVGPDNDAAELLRCALAARPRRVVVKRPLRAEPLAADPAFTHKGQAVRYDVYLPDPRTG